MSVLPEIQAQQLIAIKARSTKSRSVSLMKKAIKNENLVETHKLQKSVKGKVHLDYGDVDRISFTLLRYGFIKSAGINTPYQIHSGQTMPAQPATNWIGKALDKPTKDLADFVAGAKANAVVKTIKFNGKEL